MRRNFTLRNDARNDYLGAMSIVPPNISDIDALALAIDPDRDTYRKGYRVTAAFLAWLEKHDHPAVVHDLNRGCAEGHCSVDLFVSCCGKDVDALWSDFTNDLRRARAAKPGN